ncbi:MAG: carotenoid biosynthesis protein [Sphingobium sp.]
MTMAQEEQANPPIRAGGGVARQASGWTLIAVSLLITVMPYAVPAAAPFALLAQIMVLMAFAWVHGVPRYGAAGMGLFMVAFFVVINLLENLSIETGFPFGYFEHLAPMGPKLFNVPLIVGPGYFGAAYLSWIIAVLLLDGADNDGRPGSLPALAIVAALVVTGYDAVGDPGGATLQHAWAYRDGGGYYGVPLSNFGGWIVTTVIAFLLGGWLMLRRSARRPAQPLWWWLQAPVMLAAQTIGSPLALALLPPRLEQDPAGNVWNSAHLYEGTTVVAIVATFAFAVTAALVALRRAPG